MQIVINIDDNLYTRLFDNGVTDAVDMLKACIAIRKGTVLPKEHGRLIDEKTVYKKFYCQNLAKVAKEVLDDTPTVIEADKEIENDD